MIKSAMPNPTDQSSQSTLDAHEMRAQPQPLSVSRVSMSPLSQLGHKLGSVLSVGTLATTLLLSPGVLGRSSAIAQTPPPEAQTETTQTETAEPPSSSTSSPFGDTNSDEDEMSYGELLRKIDNGEVSDVELDQINGIARVRLKTDAEDAKLREVKIFSNDRNLDLQERLRASDVDWEAVRTADNSAITSVITTAFVGLVVMFAFLLLLKKSASSGGGAMSFGRSKARFQMEAKTGIMFEDVAGIDEAKEELQEVVTFLKNPERFTAIGARIPKGVLLVGPPGTGKTLLAKAIAGEAGTPFFSISGSEFVEMFVGVGASRVRDLFKKAKESAPCIVFIDEIDAVGRQRGTGIGGGNDEREQTLNQLLTEMDGFEGNSGIIVIAATNRPDVLDSALLRPGRFDRQVTVDLPGYKGRLGILEVHARDKKIADAVKLDAIARRTPGFSGAQLANLLNEAAILTARRRKDAITMLEVDDAIDRLTIGLTLTPLLDNKKKRLLAYDVVGQALMAALCKHFYPIDKITILPRGGGRFGEFVSTGFVSYSYALEGGEVDDGLTSYATIVDMIAVYMAGRATESIVFGTDEITNVAARKIKDVTRIARQMVTQLGMSELGAFAMETDSSQPFLGGSNFGQSGREYSDEFAFKIDQKLKEIVQEGLERATETIKVHRPLVDRLVDLLVEKETIGGQEFMDIVSEHTQLPVAEPAKLKR